LQAGTNNNNDTNQQSKQHSTNKDPFIADEYAKFIDSSEHETFSQFFGPLYLFSRETQFFITFRELSNSLRQATRPTIPKGRSERLTTINY
jgi:hypothetical protein